MPATPHTDRTAAAQQQHSLPSFAQGFSGLSADHEHDRGHNRAIPPLQMHRGRQQQNQPRRPSASPLLVAGTSSTTASTTTTAATNRPNHEPNTSSSSPSSSTLSPPQARSAGNTASRTASTAAVANKSATVMSGPAHHRVSMAGPSSASATTSPRLYHSARHKRPRSPSTADAYDSSASSSPREIVKQEQDVDQLDPSPSPQFAARRSPETDTRPLHSDRHPQSSLSSYAEPPPKVKPSSAVNDSNSPLSSLSHSSLGPPPPLKRRRVTISGSNARSLHLNTTNLPSELGSHTPVSGAGGNQALSYHASSHGHPISHSHSHTGPSTPISPVVIGFTIQPDDPQAIEQVRSMIVVKQKQKALIESRRGSIAGLAEGRRGSVGGLDAASSGASVGAGGRMSRRGSVASAAQAAQQNQAPAVNIMNATPTSSTAPVAASMTSASVGKRSSQNGASEKRHRGPSPPCLSPSISASRSPQVGVVNADIGTRARSPSNLVGTRMPSPNSRSIQGNQQSQPIDNARLPRASGQTAASGNSPITEPGHVPLVQRQQVLSPSLQSSILSQSASLTSTSTGSVTNQGQVQQLIRSQGSSSLANNLPPVPTSFARRRASQLSHRGKQKPADLLISPRENTSSDATAPRSGALMGESPGHPRTGDGLSALDAHQRQQYQPATQGPVQTQISLLSSNRPRVPSRNARGDYAMLKPAIQSAPPRPGTHPGQFPPMALPRLPSELSQGTSAGVRANASVGGGAIQMRRVPGQVPPTPTALSMQCTQAATGGGALDSANVRLSQPTGASRIPGLPRTATGATFFGASTHRLPPSRYVAQGGSSSGGFGANHSTDSSTGVEQGHTQTGTGFGAGNVPRTPATFHRVPGNDVSGCIREENKAAFLAPFEQFYDALSDAQVLKGWFSEQLRRMGKVMRDAEQQIDRMKIVEKEITRKEANSIRGIPSNINAASHAGSSSEVKSSAASAVHEPNSGFAKTEIELMISDVVRQEVRGWREEAMALRARVAELEDASYTANTSRRRPRTMIGEQQMNGMSASSKTSEHPRITFSDQRMNSAIESYIFPPALSPSQLSGVDRERVGGSEAGGEMRPRSASPLLAAHQAPQIFTHLHPHSYGITRTADLRAQFLGSRELNVGVNSSTNDANSNSRSPTPTPSSVMGLAPASGQPRQTQTFSDHETGDASSSCTASRATSHANSASRSSSVDVTGLGLGGPGRRLSVSAMRYEPRIPTVQETAELRREGDRDEERERERETGRHRMEAVRERESGKKDKDTFDHSGRDMEEIRRDRGGDSDRETKETGIETYTRRRGGDAKRVSFEKPREQELDFDKRSDKIDSRKSERMPKHTHERSHGFDELDALNSRTRLRQDKPVTDKAAARKEVTADDVRMDTT